MNTSSSIAHIAPALIKAQATIGAASKDAKNPFYLSTYADLGSVMAVCKEPLLAQGISILQPLSTRDNGDIILATMLLHESGEFISSEMKITPPKRMVCPKSDKEKFEPYLAPDPQAEGSAITYARRYSLQALVGIPSVDDDAEWAERALSRRPLTQETAEKLGTAVEQTIAAADATTDEAERQRLHKEAMKLEKGIQQRTPEAIAIAEYEEKNPEHRNKVACATQDEKGNWTFTLVGGEKPKTTRTRKTTPPAETQQEPARIEQGMDTPWREFICLRGPAGGMMNGNTLEKIFVTGHMAPNSPQKLDRLMAWFPQESIPTSSDPHDKVLWAKVQEAEKELRAKFATGSPATPASTQTTPAPTKPAQQAASPTDWREFEIPGKNVAFSGHKLGDFADRMMEVKEYADSIDMARANLSQKSFKANVSLAMAELHPSAQPAELPLAANGGIVPHTKQILDIMTVKKWNPAFFVMQCKINGWLPEEARKIEDITAEDFASLEAEWATVEAEVDKAHQPEQRV